MRYEDHSQRAIAEVKRRTIPLVNGMTAAVRDEVVDVIESANPSGERYPHPTRSGTYRASAPGEPPASPTGAYPESWQTDEAEVRGDRVSGAAFSDSEVAPDLEFGSAGPPPVEPRPHARPALQRVRGKVERMVREASG